MLMLDPNLVAALWGVAALYGVLVSILVIRADQIYESYIEKGTKVWYERARTWAWTTLAIPVIAFVAIVALSVIAIGKKNGVPVTWPPGANFWNILIAVISMVVFAGIVFMLVRVPPPFELSLIRCEDAGELVSVDTTWTKTKMTFINNSPTAVQYIWVDRHGVLRKEGFCRELRNDGQPQLEETWAGHLWKVQDMGGKCICYVRAREQPGAVIIS